MSSEKMEKRLASPPKTARGSVSFPPELYETLKQIAQEKKVSVAWVVRDAVEKYVESRWPLFGGKI
jgi:predicted transcriptional regulator